jgi:hypothetical protein
MKKKEKEMTTEKPKAAEETQIRALIDDCERNARQGRRRRGVS